MNTPLPRSVFRDNGYAVIAHRGSSMATVAAVMITVLRKEV